jgi:hypothetical protein
MAWRCSPEHGQRPKTSFTVHDACGHSPIRLSPRDCSLTPMEPSVGPSGIGLSGSTGQVWGAEGSFRSATQAAGAAQVDGRSQRPAPLPCRMDAYLLSRVFKPEPGRIRVFSMPSEWTTVRPRCGFVSRMSPGNQGRLVWHVYELTVGLRNGCAPPDPQGPARSWPPRTAASREEL